MFISRHKDEEVRFVIEQAGPRLQIQETCFRPEEVAPIIELSKLRMTKESRHSHGADGVLRVPLVVPANGVNFIVIKPGL